MMFCQLQSIDEHLMCHRTKTGFFPSDKFVQQSLRTENGGSPSRPSPNQYGSQSIFTPASAVFVAGTIMTSTRVNACRSQRDFLCIEPTSSPSSSSSTFSVFTTEAGGSAPCLWRVQ